MTPDFKILADSQDVTATIRDRLLSLSVTDAAGMHSDTVEIHLDDRAPYISLPRTGAELLVSLGYLETGLAKMGMYVVDEVGISGPPDSLIIRAKAANMRKSFKAPKSRSFGGLTIDTLVAIIASEHGYTEKVAESLADVTIDHLDQSEESDLHLLTRLAKDHGAVSKPAGGLLLFVPKGEAKSASGIKLESVSCRCSDLSRWSVTIAERDKYAAVEARWRDLQAAKDEVITVGAGEPVFVIRHSYPDAATATTAAKAKLEAFERGAATISGSMPGDNKLMAESTLTMTDGRPGLSGDWLLKQVTHVIDTGGYRCDFEGETPKQ